MQRSMRRSCRGFLVKLFALRLACGQAVWSDARPTSRPAVGWTPTSRHGARKTNAIWTGEIGIAASIVMSRLPASSRPASTSSV